MTNELEKTFFDTFGIEPECETRAEYRKHECYGMVDCAECASDIYPQITDRILLELICIDYAENPYTTRGYVSGVEELKTKLLKEFINQFEFDLFRDREEIKQQVQALFKESEQE